MKSPLGRAYLSIKGELYVGSGERWPCIFAQPVDLGEGMSCTGVAPDLPYLVVGSAEEREERQPNSEADNEQNDKCWSYTLFRHKEGRAPGRGRVPEKMPNL